MLTTCTSIPITCWTTQQHIPSNSWGQAWRSCWWFCPNHSLSAAHQASASTTQWKNTTPTRRQKSIPPLKGHTWKNTLVKQDTCTNPYFIKRFTAILQLSI